MTNHKNFEIEVRGPLNKDQYNHLLKFLSQKGKKKSYKKRILIDYSESIGNKKLDKRNVDLRIRSTNGIPEIILKRGKWAAQDARDEISILTKRGSFDKLVQFFGAVGITKGVLCERNISVFDYKNIEFAIIEIAGEYYTYEAEILLDNKNDSEASKKKINEVCHNLGLDIFSDKEFFDFIKMLNKSINKKFDFTDYKSGFFENKYGI